MTRRWLTELACTRVHVCCISSRFSSFHMLMFFGLFSCTGPAVQCASGDLCIGVRGCGFLNHMTSSWHMSVCGPTLVAVCVCVSLFLTLPFLCVFFRKKQTPASTLHSYAQTSRSVDQQSCAYLFSDICTPAVITITHCYNTRSFTMLSW